MICIVMEDWKSGAVPSALAGAAQLGAILSTPAAGKCHLYSNNRHHSHCACHAGPVL